MRRSLVVVVLFSPPLLSAQTTRPHERALPKACTGAWGPSGGAYNSVVQGTRLNQMWFRGDNLPIPYVLREVGTRLGKQVTGSTAAKFNFEMTFDNSAVTWGTMSADPTKNLGQNATIVFSGTLDLQAVGPSTDPNTADMWLKTTKPFVFAGQQHLLVQIKWTPLAVNGIRRHNGFNTNNTTSTAHMSAGKSCGGTLTASQSTAGMYSMSVASAPPKAVCVFMLAVENVVLGRIPFPIDLTSAGLTGCQLGIVPLVFLAKAADATGNATLSFPYAVSTTDTDVWSVQVVHQTTANSIGWATTNVVNSVLGRIGLVRALRIDKRGTAGPSTWNATTGPILLVRGL